ncbi:MAG: FMN-binding protein [Micrococcales bacterium]
MPSSRKFITSTVLFATLSVGGAVLINDLCLNPEQAIVAGTASHSTGSSTANTNKTLTGTSAAIQYMYGTIQLKVTQVNGKITAIEELTAQATDGREQAFPTLKSAAIQANGSNFGNLSGATYTTDAYKKALDSALSNLG